jgi:hypothetical protein
MQLVVVKEKGNNKKLEGHSAMLWSKQIQNFHGAVFGEKSSKL